MPKDSFPVFPGPFPAPAGPESSAPAASSARTSRMMALGSLRSTWSTMDGDSTVRGRIQLTSSPASVSRSTSCSGPKHRVIRPSGQGTSTTSACGRSVSWAHWCCSARMDMPRTSESTLARSWPPGRSTRAISAATSSAIRCRDSAPSSAITPSTDPSARKARFAESATTCLSRPAEARRRCAPRTVNVTGSSSARRSEAAGQRGMTCSTA